LAVDGVDIQGKEDIMTEYLFCCSTCTEDLVYEGNLQEATALCPNCGEVTICPDEVLASIEDERRMDADRDDRLMRDD
jgi:predicted RNA-binding Zn-ribbon protein involved in translation (DUF1610 family)